MKVRGTKAPGDWIGKIHESWYYKEKSLFSILTKQSRLGVKRLPLKLHSPESVNQCFHNNVISCSWGFPLRRCYITWLPPSLFWNYIRGSWVVTPEVLPRGERRESSFTGCCEKAHYIWYKMFDGFECLGFRPVAWGPLLRSPHLPRDLACFMTTDGSRYGTFIRPWMCNLFFLITHCKGRPTVPPPVDRHVSWL